jgi:hypothetical protein
MTRLAPIAAAGLAALLSGRPAPAVERGPYTVEILVGGSALAEYHACGTVYVEATDGREYAVRLSNRTPARVAVALSIDGLNSIDAKTTSARDARKWILGPYETITLEGWQTGFATARRFVFTSEARSYGAWLGRTRNLGIVSAAFFPEKAARPATAAPPCVSGAARQGRAAEPGSTNAKSEASDAYAATGIGREVRHEVREIPFDAEPVPAASIDLRYEFHDALVRLGVLRSFDGHLRRRESARGFPEEGFAPDPYRRRD